MGENAPVSNPYAPPSEGASRPDLRPDASRAPRPAPDDSGPTPHGPRAPHPQQRPPATPPPPPDPEAMQHVSRQIMHFGLLMIGALLAYRLPFPWMASTLVLVVAAIVVGIRALRTTWRARITGALVPMLVVGLTFAGMFLVSVLATLAVWPVSQQLRECERDALTESATAECTQEFNDSLERLAPQLVRDPSGG